MGYFRNGSLGTVTSVACHTGDQSTADQYYVLAADLSMTGSASLANHLDHKKSGR